MKIIIKLKSTYWNGSSLRDYKAVFVFISLIVCVGLPLRKHESYKRTSQVTISRV